MPTAYLSITEAARRLGLVPRTVCRMCHRAGVGIVVENGRVVAVKDSDLPKLRKAVKAVGNPGIGALAKRGAKARWKRGQM